MISIEQLKSFTRTHGANVRIARRRLRGGGVNEYVMLYAYAATDEARGRQPTVYLCPLARLEHITEAEVLKKIERLQAKVRALQQ
jgi:hypothetical protein